MNTDTDNNAVEIGLKTEVKRQVGLKEWEKDVGNHTQCHLVNSWKALYSIAVNENCDILKLRVRDLIWNYCLSSPNKIWIKVNSSVFGIYSTIGEYTNKKGNKSLAHFTENGHYIGSVLKLGKEPIGYIGNFQLSTMRFNLNLEKLDTLTTFNGAYILERLFEPIPVVL